MTPDQLRARRGRTVATGLVLGLLALMFFAISILEWVPQALQRAVGQG